MIPITSEFQLTAELSFFSFFLLNACNFISFFHTQIGRDNLQNAECRTQNAECRMSISDIKCETCAFGFGVSCYKQLWRSHAINSCGGRKFARQDCIMHQATLSTLQFSVTDRNRSLALRGDKTGEETNYTSVL